MTLSENRLRRVTRQCFALCLLVGLSAAGVRPAAAQDKTAPAAITKDYWIGTYINGKKSGYTSVHTTNTSYEGKPATDTVSHSLVKIQMLGANVEQDVTQHTISDAAGRPLVEVFDLASNGSTIHLDARYDYAASEIVCKVGSPPDVTTKKIKIPKDAVLAGDTTFGITEQPVVGKKYTYYALEPLSAELQPTQVEVVKKENVTDTLTGKEIPVFVVTIKTSGGTMTAWMQDADNMVKSEIAVGPVVMLMRNEPKALALNLKSPDLPAVPNANGTKKYVPPADFAVATAVVSDKTLPDPRRLRSLQVEISGIPEQKFVLDDARQKVTASRKDDSTDTVTAQYNIHVEAFDAAKSAQIPVTSGELQPYLTKAAYLDTDNAQIKATALKLRGQETSLYRIAAKIRDWVSANMTPDASIGVPRSATDIFGRKRGVCRDYATLYTALCRAAGVPTRLCTGIVYAEGRFFYHAWAESYVGAWVTFDPTLYDTHNPVSYVDATHIKFAQGDVLQMFDVVAVVGKLHLTVQKFAP